MSSDSEIDDLQKFEDSHQRRLAAKAGLSRNQVQDDDLSDEEVLGIGSGSGSESDDPYGYYEQDDNTVKDRREQVERKIDDNWGNTRDNYFGGEDDIGADEGASDEEEAEALRLQQKELEEMSESDFFDEDDMEGWKKEADAGDVDAPKEAQAIDPSTMTADERRELIEEKFPAVLLLTKELSKIKDWEAELETDEDTSEELRKIGQTALNTYKGMVYSFFALFEDRLRSGDISGLTSLEEHPVNEGLLMARQLWLNYQQISKSKSEMASEQGSDLDLADPENAGVSMADPAESDMSESNDEDLADLNGETDLSDYGSNDEQVDEEDADEFSIAKPQSRAKTNKRLMVDDFDEAADTIEQQARAKNKQSLRFYTSQIGKDDQKTRQSYSGDVDLPYREREFERRQRLMAEAQKRGSQQKDRFDNDADDFDMEDDNDSYAAADRANVYSDLKNKRDASREERKQRNAEAMQAARAGRIAEYIAENPNVDKRAVNYQIEKNKGLTPKRKKENRNARVKKRLRYEAAQKKLKGVRRTYKGPEGPYQGELTGIRKNLTHSTRFKN